MNTKDLEVVNVDEGDGHAKSTHRYHVRTVANSTKLTRKSIRSNVVVTCESKGKRQRCRRKFPMKVFDDFFFMSVMSSLKIVRSG